VCVRVCVRVCVCTHIERKKERDGAREKEKGKEICTHMNAPSKQKQYRSVYTPTQCTQTHKHTGRYTSKKNREKNLKRKRASLDLGGSLPLSPFSPSFSPLFFLFSEQKMHVFAKTHAKMHVFAKTVSTLTSRRASNLR